MDSGAWVNLGSGCCNSPSAGVNRILPGVLCNGYRVGTGAVSAAVKRFGVSVHIRDDDLLLDSVLAPG